MRLTLSEKPEPDFLCIGMPKAGTGWLFDQLKHHPDFWLPPVKEVAYLNHKKPRLTRSSDAFSKKRKKMRHAARAGRKHTEARARDFAFLKAAAASSGLPRDLSLYASLFRFKGSLKSGDITPGYSLLEADIIEQIATDFPEIKIVFLVRDPIARAWSHICMGARNRTFNQELLEDPAKFRKYLVSQKVMLRFSMATQIVSKWREAAPRVSFQHFFFDDIVDQPVATRRAILLYLGADPEGGDGPPADFNRKASLPKLPMTDVARAALIEHLASEVTACAAQFGGPAERWPALYGL